MSQDTGKDTKDSKTNQADTAELVSQIEALKQSNAELLKETMARKEKLRAFEETLKQKEESALIEQQKYKELYEKATPQVNRLQSLLPKLESIYNLEIADIPEDKRELIPNVDIEAKIEWVKTAKQKGLFATQKEEKKPVNSVQSKTGVNDAGTPEYVGWAANDPRLVNLTTKEYQVWKSHNRKPSNTLFG